MGFPELRRERIPPVAPSAKKKNIPPKSFGCKSFALALISCISRPQEEQLSEQSKTYT